jgi:protein SCO1/2
LLCLAALLVPCAHADLLPNRGVKFDQKLGAQIPLDAVFRDEAGQSVSLGDYFKDGKPVILVLAYYRCPQLCTQILNDLVDAMLHIDAKLGDDYRVLTVSFDARETPELAAKKKSVYIARYGRLEAAGDWHFLTGEKESIKRLTEAVGFQFRYDQRFDQFAHGTGIMVLTPKGKASRYLMGLMEGNWKPRDLQFSLIDASGNKIGSLMTQFYMHLCFQYNPGQGRYDFAVLTIVRIGGVLTVLGIIFMVGRFLWQEKKQSRLALNGTGLPHGQSSVGH